MPYLKKTEKQMTYYSLLFLCPTEGLLVNRRQFFAICHGIAVQSNQSTYGSRRIVGQHTEHRLATKARDMMMMMMMIMMVIIIERLYRRRRLKGNQRVGFKDPEF
jgi:hypothetical protein